MNTIFGTFHDASTGATITRELTPDEIDELVAAGWTETGKETPIASPQSEQ